MKSSMPSSEGRDEAHRTGGIWDVNASACERIAAGHVWTAFIVAAACALTVLGRNAFVGAGWDCREGVGPDVTTLTGVA